MRGSGRRRSVREDPPAAEAEAGRLPAERSTSSTRFGRLRSPHERPAIVLMEGAGLRSCRGSWRAGGRTSTWSAVVCGCCGRASTGSTSRSLRMWSRSCATSFRDLQPELDDHVFTVEVEQWVSQFERERRREGSEEAGERAGAVADGRRGSAGAPASRALTRTSCATASRTASCARAAATWSRCGPLMGHSRIDTTQLYTDELDVDELAAALAERDRRRRNAQASSESGNGRGATLKYPRNRLVEAAGIEPASAAAPAERLQA